MTKNNPSSKIAQIWQKYTNPLRGMTEAQIEQLMTNARYGNDIRLQLAFYEMERMTPIFQVCIDKRTSGVINRQWDIVTIDDTTEAKSQQEMVRKILRKSDMLNEDGLTEAIKHLCMASFRGRSAIKPFFDDDGNLFFKKLYNWNVVSYNGKNYWNPTADMTMYNDKSNSLVSVDKYQSNLKDIPKDEICIIHNERPIDLPGLMIYLRQLVGEEQWARFVEKSGIPQIILTAPQGTPESELNKWNLRAQTIFEGASGCMPNGTGTHLLTEGRGQDMFTSFVEHQMEMISILATGGTLMTIGGSTGLGSDLARVQQESFNSLVSQDCKKIANALSNTVIKKCVSRIFGDDAECKIRFDFVEKDDTTAEEYVTLAERLKNIGVSIDVKKLKELTKLSFIGDEVKDIWSPDNNDNGNKEV